MSSRSFSTCCAVTCLWSARVRRCRAKSRSTKGHACWRLLVKPGSTGLWTSQRPFNLSWEDTVWLDLQYVENWSLGLDVAVLAKTGVIVVRGNGAC
jgi:lipopolysaccharide/colanic/teichoic acid biosynthesis glycosyltransferase